MSAFKFRTEILAAGKTATGIQVPEEVVAGLGSTKRPAVRVTINGHSYRSTIATVSGRFMVGVSAENRKEAGVGAGDVVNVKIELDTEQREVTIPRDFADALNKSARAKRNFEALSYSIKRRHVMSIEDAKTPETRQRRITKAIATLKDAQE